MTERKLLAALAIHYEGDWSQIYKALVDKRYLPDDVVENYLSNTKSNYVTYFDKEYPSYLKEMLHPPFVLFYYGDISLIQDPNNCLAVIGTREPTTNGISQTKNIIYTLNKDVIVVSGLARGIDAVAHATSFKMHRKTIAVLGCGIDNVYPIENEKLYLKFKKSKDNLIISEYPAMVAPDAFHFPARNRLIAMFSSSILVTEAKLQSGTLITAGFGVQLNRKILCVPSIDYGNSGCNQLIREGAILVENGEQVNEFYE